MQERNDLGHIVRTTLIRNDSNKVVDAIVRVECDHPKGHIHQKVNGDADYCLAVEESARRNLFHHKPYTKNQRMI